MAVAQDVACLFQQKYHCAQRVARIIVIQSGFLQVYAREQLVLCNMNSYELWKVKLNFDLNNREISYQWHLPSRTRGR